jgi:putative spermidine/putrescine transport system permease protein
VLLAPSAALYIAIYFGGLVMLVLSSLGMAYGGEGSFDAYIDMFNAPVMGGTVLRTLRVSLATVFFCLLLGFPVARYLATSTGKGRSIILMCVLSPLMVTTIGRIFGWIAFFGPGSFIAHAMEKYLGGRPVGLLFTETAMIIGLTNLMLPFMVLSIVGARLNVDESTLKAAKSLGAKPLAVLWQVEIPQCLPGIVSGVLIVFCLSISNFGVAALLGGNGNNTVAYEIYLDTLIYFKGERGAAISVLLLVVVGLLMSASLYVGSRSADRSQRDERT